MNHTDCEFGFVPETEILSNFRIAVFTEQENGSQSEQSTLATYLNTVVTNVTIVNNHQPVNRSVCSISNLEVYRGREEVTEISHDGFSLTDRGTVEVKHYMT